MEGISGRVGRRRNGVAGWRGDEPETAVQSKRTVGISRPAGGGGGDVPAELDTDERAERPAKVGGRPWEWAGGG